MADVADLNLKAKADVSDAKKNISDLNDHVQKSSGFFGNALSSLVGFVGGSAIVGVATTAFGILSDTIKESVSVAAQDQNVQAQLSAALKSTHDSVGLTAGGLNDLAEKLSLTTTFSKDTTLQAEEMGLRFTNIGSTVFPQMISAAQDLSARMGIDLNGAVKLVGRALDDPAKGFSALSRYGITFSTELQKNIKDMVAHGQTAQAQALILDQLKEKFGGAAAAAGGTFAGKLQILQNSFEEVKVKIGNAVIPILSQLLSAVQPIINEVGDILPPLLGQAAVLLQNIAPPVVGLISGLLAPITGLVNQFVDFDTHAGKAGGTVQTLARTVSGVLPALQGVGIAFETTLLPALKSTVPSLQILGNALLSILAPAFNIVVTIVKDVLPPVMNVLGTLFRNLAPLLAVVAASIASQVVPALTQIVPVIKPILDNLAQWIDQLLNILVPILQVALPVAIDILVVAFKVVLDVVSAVWPIIASVIGSAFSIITDLFNVFKDLFTGNWQGMWNNIVKLFGDIFGIIPNLTVAVIGAIARLLGDLWGVIGPVVTQFATSLWNFWIGMNVRLAQITYDGLMTVVNWFAGLNARVMGAIANVAEGLYRAGMQWMTNIGNGINDGIVDVIVAIRNLENQVINALKNLIRNIESTLSNAPGIGGSLQNIFNHIGFASGTANAPGGFATVGEGGEPELVVGPHFGYLPKGSGVYPLSHLAGSPTSGGGGGGSQTIMVYLDGQVLAATTVKNTPRVVRLLTGMKN